jgi:hypothetical protein
MFVRIYWGVLRTFSEWFIWKSLGFYATAQREQSIYPRNFDCESFLLSRISHRNFRICNQRYSEDSEKRLLTPQFNILISRVLTL